MSNDLSLIAADVAQALELIFPGTGQWWTDKEIDLYFDGSNLTDPYWRCRCEDWLLERGWSFSAHQTPMHPMHVAVNMRGDMRQLLVECPWPEAPARLVSAVWQKMKDGYSEGVNGATARRKSMAAEYKLIPTTPEVYTAIYGAHWRHLKPFFTVSEPTGGAGGKARMYTEWGFEGADYPTISIDEVWYSDVEQPSQRNEEERKCLGSTTTRR